MSARGPSIRSEGGKVRRVAVVGGGIAGSMAALELAEARVAVDVFSVVPVRRSHSVIARGGMLVGPASRERDDAQRLFEEVIAAGCFLAHQPPVLGMIEAAPEITALFDRMGVPFHRTPEGLLDRRALAGSRARRAVFSGASTGQQMLHALDEQLRRLSLEPMTDDRGVRIPGESLVRKLEHWDFLRIVTDDAGTCVGLVAQDLRSMAIKAFPYDAVLLATGGPGGVFAGSAFSASSNGSAVAAVVEQGAVYANGEFIQVHPTALWGPDKKRVISDALRAEGGRLWVPKDKSDARSPREIPEKERDYFFESAFHHNLPAFDEAARAIHRVVFEEERGLLDPKAGKAQPLVYLDVTHVDPERLRSRAGAALELAETFAGIDATAAPLPVGPAVHYSMGGLWVDYDKTAGGRLVERSPRSQATSIPGLYAAGEADYQYHGANRLGGASLLSCAFGGRLAARGVSAYRAAMERSALDLPQSIFDKAQKSCEEAYKRLLDQGQDAEDAESPYAIAEELGAVMNRDCTIVRDDEKLTALLGRLDEIGERVKAAKSPDVSPRANPCVPFLRALGGSVTLAKIIAASAKHRAESRGAHHKPARPGRDDAAWLKSTLVRWKDGAPAFIRGFAYACAGKRVEVEDTIDTCHLRPETSPVKDGGESDG
ncbi:MAG: FAD-binding protein [Myxococcales bacterium]|nr:FAD-binding protein [Myxococcales bacterium]